MPRNVAIIKTSVWTTDFSQLHWRAQWVYLMLVTQRQINTCGILPYTPDRWQHMAAGSTRQGIMRGLTELADREFIIIDKSAGELLVRTYIRHDGVWKKPNLVVAAQAQFQEILSEPIRTYLAEAHPWLADVSAEVTEGVSEGVREGVPERVSNPRAQAHPPSSFLLPPTSLPDKPARKRDELWDSLTLELGSTPSTASERGRWNAALKQLRDVGATPVELRSRCKVYRKRWPEVSLTPTALAANWGSLNSTSEMEPRDRWKHHFAAKEQP